MVIINSSIAGIALQCYGLGRLAIRKLVVHQQNAVLLLAVFSITFNGHLIAIATAEIIKMSQA